MIAGGDPPVADALDRHPTDDVQRPRIDTVPVALHAQIYLTGTAGITKVWSW